MGFLDQIAETEVPEVNERGTYDGPPRIRRSTGAKANHHSLPDVPGLFYVAEQTLGGNEPLEPWRKVQWYKDEVGYEAEELDIIFITRKSQPFSEQKDAKGKVTKRLWQERWVDGVSQRVLTEYLCYVQGFFDPEEPIYGQPVIWSMKGMMGMRVDALIKEYREKVLDVAGKMASEKKGKTVRPPMWMFRLHLGPERKGAKYVFTETGHGAVVQLPSLVLPPTIDDKALSDLYVGNDLLQHLKSIYDEYGEWRTTMRTNNEENAQQAPEGQSQGQQA